MWACGFSMVRLVPEDTPLRETLYSLHVSIGVTLLYLVVARTCLRVAFAVPELPADIPRWQQRSAHLAHAALYVLPARTMVAGWAETDFDGHAFEWFGLPMRTVFPVPAAGYAEIVHAWLAYGMLAVALVHAGAAVRHGRDMLRRMSP